MPTMTDFIKPSPAHYYAYRIARGEQGVLTYEPYKSHLLPLWRFRTVPIATDSSRALWDKFLFFYKEGDFVGMDMSRKFIQMGMTRAKRYANHKGGRKYVDGKANGNLIEKSKGHEGKEEKEEASRIFKEVWQRCREHEGYGELKKEFLKEQKEWEDSHEDDLKDMEVDKYTGQLKKEEKAQDDAVKKEDIKSEDGGTKLSEVDETPPKKTRKRLKKESD